MIENQKKGENMEIKFLHTVNIYFKRLFRNRIDT